MSAGDHAPTGGVGFREGLAGTTIFGGPGHMAVRKPTFIVPFPGGTTPAMAAFVVPTCRGVIAVNPINGVVTARGT